VKFQCDVEDAFLSVARSVPVGLEFYDWFRYLFRARSAVTNNSQ
jgi:hypothetical protein